MDLLINIFVLGSRLSCGILSVIFRLILALFSVNSRSKRKSHDQELLPDLIKIKTHFPLRPSICLTPSILERADCCSGEGWGGFSF
jgi:hypothetical protein